jgi:hypothetical protein
MTAMKLGVVIATVAAAASISACSSGPSLASQVASCNATAICAQYLRVFTGYTKQGGGLDGESASAWCASQVTGLDLQTNWQSAAYQQLVSNQGTVKRACSLAASEAQQ